MTDKPFEIYKGYAIRVHEDRYTDPTRRKNTPPTIIYLVMASEPVTANPSPYAISARSVDRDTALRDVRRQIDMRLLGVKE